MRKLLWALAIAIAGTSCVTTTKVYRSPFYSMNKKDTVYIQKSDTSLFYSDAQLMVENDMVRAVPDKKVKSIAAVDSMLQRKLKDLNYKTKIVGSQWKPASKGLLINYRDYWINEQDPTFYRFWMQGSMLKDSSSIIVYEGAPIPTTAGEKPDPEKELKLAVSELTIPGTEVPVDDSEIYTVEDELLLSRAKFYGALNAGVGRRFGNSYSEMQPSEKSHREDLNTGITLGADLGYYFKPYFGLGVSCSYFHTNEIKDSVKIETGNRKITDQVDILYAGPALLVRNLYFQGRMSSVLIVSGGYLDYKDTQKIFVAEGKSYDNTMTASGFGGKINAGVDYIFNKWLGAGLNLGLQLGKLSVDDEYMKKTEKISMNQYTVSLGVRIFL